MNKPALNFELPEKSNLASRFNFIDDKDLKAQLSIAIEYVTFLIGLSEQYQIQPTVLFSIYKDIVLHTSCIVEACLHHALKKISNVGTDKEKEALRKHDKKYKKVTKYHIISPQEAVVCAIEKVTSSTINDDAKFNDLVTSAKKIQLFDNDLCAKAHYLRKKRNEIHLFSSDSRVSIYNKRVINKVFAETKDVLRCLENKLTSI